MSTLASEDTDSNDIYTAQNQNQIPNSNWRVTGSVPPAGMPGLTGAAASARAGSSLGTGAAATGTTIAGAATATDRYSPSIAASSISSSGRQHASSSLGGVHDSPPSSNSNMFSHPVPPPPTPSSFPASDSQSRRQSTTSASTAPPPLHPAIPVEPMPDSILCRSTFAALEHSAGTLKRLAKHVVAQASSVLALLEQLETAEDELMVALGELGRWLEGGYGVTGDVWDAEGGIRKVASERRRRDREDLEVMVIHSLEAVKGEIKRQGLAGHGAQAKFESVAKQYYQSTATYLAPTANGSHPDIAADLAQATRTAQWELVRYNHHSTLLYAVPPSSVGCLDLLVGLYGWVGAQISHVPGKRADTHPMVATDDFARPSPKDGTETPTQRGRQLAHMETPVRILTRDDVSARSSVDAVTRTLATSLGHLVQVRGDLLMGWAERDKQTTLLEENARRLSEGVPEANRLNLPLPTSDSSSSFNRDSKPRKMHKIHSSVGGKIRGLFSSSSNNNLPTLAERAPPVSSASMPPQDATDSKRKSMDASRPVHPLLATQSRTQASPASAPRGLPPPPPPRPPKSGGNRNRHSLQVPQGQYRSPFHPIEGPPQMSATPRLDDRKTALAETAAKLNGVSVGGVGGLNGEGDEAEQREQAGRKKEGVLWGTGAWEGLDKGGAKGRWEHFWVVLAHSKIYEYRDGNKGESTATVIDLKFASVREGRGTDRRFVFEIVTPSQGRRLYQAASEAEMRTWIYAVCNAIESCINGTSTMRSTDFKAMQESMNIYPEQQGKKGSDKSSEARIPFPSPMQSSTAQMSARHSLPAPPRESRHTRRTSLKDRIMGADFLPQKLSKEAPPLESRPAFLSQGGRMPSYPSSSISSAHHSSIAEDTDAEIEKRVYEMAGLGIRSSKEDMRRSSNAPSLPPIQHGSFDHSQILDAAPDMPKYDMAMLRRVADTPANSRCADCGRRTKSSRWATQSLRDVPMVMFLCIRCCGVHRGLGTHISKPRSVDLDNWSPEMVLLAYTWGNERGNAMWERCKPADLSPTDEDIGDYIRAKYVEARWVAPEDRIRYGLDGPGGDSRSGSSLAAAAADASSAEAIGIAA